MGQRLAGMKAEQIARVAAVVACSLALAHCGKTSNIDSKYGVSASARVIEPGQPVPKGGGAYRVGKPYQIAGRTYTPEENAHYSAVGVASWYGDDFHGRRTANGEIFDMNSIAAAHPTLPMPSYVRVTNLANSRSLIVRVNDRGPYHADRVIDVSVRAAQLLGFHSNGIAKVRVDYVGRASLQGSDDEKLAATLRTGAPVMMASNKPFRPDYFDPKPMTTVALREPARETRQAFREESRPEPREVRQEAYSGRAEPEARPAPRPVALAAVQRAPLPAGPVLASAESRPAPAPRAVWVEGPPPASFASRFGHSSGSAATGNDAVTAYAPVASRGEGYVTGRGLY
jgi:rare lipoprotein A